MRVTTELWARFESVGKPAHTVTMFGTIREIVLAQSKWIMDVYMGSHVRIIYARSEPELIGFTTRSRIAQASDMDMLTELESMIADKQGELLDGADLRAEPHMPELES